VYGFVEIHTQEIQKLNLKSSMTCLRACMTQMRLNNLTVLHIHVNLAKDIGNNLDKFVNKFISGNQWRASPFAIVKATDN